MLNFTLNPADGLRFPGANVEATFEKFPGFALYFKDDCLAGVLMPDDNGSGIDHRVVLGSRSNYGPLSVALIRWSSKVGQAQRDVQKAEEALADAKAALNAAQLGAL